MTKDSAFPAPIPSPTAPDARRSRAQAEGLAYRWLPWHDGRWLCESRSGALYLISADGCSCADWHHRCQSTGRKCKHQLALGYRLLGEGNALIRLGLALLEEEPETS